MIRRRVPLRAICAATVFLFASLTLSVSASAAPSRVSLSGSVAGFARPANLVRHVAASSKVDFELYLGLRDAAGASALLRKVSTPHTAAYAHYLTPAQFRARFARPSSDVVAAGAWLRSQGFTVGDVPENHTTIGASGTAAQVNHAFGITLGTYRTSGHVVRAADRAPSVPASLSGIVRGVIGLTPVRMHHGAIAPPPAFRSGRPCSAYWASQMATDQPRAFGRLQPRAICGYTPAQMQGAYGMTNAIRTGNDGSGVTVAVIDAFAAPTMQKDLNIYSSRHGLPQTTIHQIKLPACPVCPPGMQQGWYGEETLDLDAVHSMAPGAKLVFLGAKSDFDIDILERVNFAIDNHIASIVSNSYGDAGENLPESEIKAEEAAYQQAIVEGIGFYFSSGDCGDNLDPQGICGGTGTRATDYPASSPNVTAVGGTSIGIGKGGKYLFETGWGTTASSLGARTTVERTAAPRLLLLRKRWRHQQALPRALVPAGRGPERLAHHWGTKSGRVEPDIAADGDPNTGFLVGETQTFPNGVRYGEYRIGGTSLSSPIFAGIMALANQAAGHDLGFVNPLLYSLGGTNALHDIINPKSTVATVRTNYNNGVNAKLGSRSHCGR